MRIVSAMILLVIPGAIWPQSHSDSAPPKRAHHALVYDAANHRVLLTGGSTPLNGGQSFRFFDDLWAFDGRRWSSVATSISARSGQGVTYDSRRNRVLSFGGYCGCGNATDGRLADFLELKSDGWVEIATLAERATAEPGVSYDSKRDRVVLFGGGGANRAVFSDTWEYDGNAWARTATQGPEARQAFVMAYDEQRGVIVLYGGFGSNPGQPFSDTWTYDGMTWTRVATTGPVGRMAAGMAYDSKRGRMILFGGTNSDGFLQDTWSWDGDQWSKLADEGPPGRAMGVLAYDAERDRVVLFGGRAGWPDADLNDTWEWDGSQWSRIP